MNSELERRLWAGMSGRWYVNPDLSRRQKLLDVAVSAFLIAVAVAMTYWWW